MKKKMLSLVLAAAMVMGLAAPALAAEESDSGKIVILHTNDVHCGIDPVTDEETGAVTNIGYAGVAAYKAEMEAQYGAENVTLVDAGDAIQGGPIGTLSKGSYIVDIMNQVGYDLAIPGNHEFDYGMDNFLTLAREKAQYTYLCCNFTDLEGNAILDAYKVVDYGEVSVGYVGIDTPESFTKSTPTYFQDAAGNYIYSFSQGNEGADLYAAVQKAVDAAVADGADYVVALGHLGNEGSTDVWTSKSVIANTTGIDVFIDGHSHETYNETVQNKDGENVTLAQTGTKLANLGKVVIDTQSGEITAEQVTGYAQQDETVAAYVAGVNEEFAGVLQEVVAKSDVALTTLDPATGERAVRNAETNLGDLCADAYRVLLDADIAFVNGGGIRADIAAGDITYEDIINVHPFGNEACLVETNGQDILDALEMGASLYPEENGGFLQVSGISYTIDASVPSSVVLSDEGEFVKVDGEYRVKDVMVGDAPLDVTATYTLASHNYMLKSGGDGFVMFKDDKLLKDCVLIDNQVLINYIVDELGGVVSDAYAAPQGRITIVNAEAEEPVTEEPVVEEPETPADWADVDQSAWYAAAVSYVIENGIMGSTSTEAQVFNPNGTVTRATVYQTLYNMEGKPAVAEAASFADVAGTWYADSAAWAEDTGLTTGDGTGAYAGDRAVTRAELATIFARYAQVKGLATTAGDLSAYADAADVASWASDGMSVAVGSGILSGKPGNLLDPNGTAVRTELATILLNFSKLAPAQETEEPAEEPETDAEATYITETVSIEANGRIVPAVVTLPAGEGPFPAVVLNHGHGGSKDENTGFGGIAEALAEVGIASIRMDFPGCGDSTEPFTENTLSNMIADSNASKDYLVANYPVDADKLGILGYSMGGRLALEVITAENNPYKAAVILSGVSTPGEEAIANVLPEGMTMEEAMAQAEANGSYDYTTQYGQALSLSAQWFTDMLVDPLANIDNYTGPMLVLHGDKDDVVTDATNKLTVAAYPAAQEIIVPDADHGYGFYSDQPEVTAMVEGSITAFFQEAFADSDALSATVTSVSKYGNVTTDLTLEALAAIDAEAGDILTLTVGGAAMDVPYGTAYSDVDNGSVIALPDTDTNTLAVAINMGNFAETYSAGEGTVITVAMKEKGGYLEEYQIRNIDSLRTNDRADYASDEVFANFRPVVMGDIAEGVLYRSSSPVNPELGRNTYADALAEAAGIKTVLNLADSQEVMEAYEGYAESYYATLNVVALDMGVDFAAADFNAKLKTGLEYLIANEGPYLVHCNEGKDRAGFTTALLEALMGGTVDEIKADYMTSYENYYHVEKGSEQYEKIAESNIMNSLCTIAGVEESADLAGVDLAAAAEAYLTGTVGLSAEQVDALQAALSGTAVVEQAA